MHWLFVALLAAAPGAAADPRESCGKVIRREAGGVVGSGSGTVVRSGPGGSYVLTNRHVVPDAGLGLYFDAGGVVHPAAFVAADGAADLALIRVAAELPAVPPAAEDVPVGAELVQHGFPGGRPRTKVGRALAYRGATVAKTGVPVVHNTIRPVPGDSGAGLLWRDPAGRWWLAMVNWGGVEVEQCVWLGDIARFVAATLGE